MFKQDLIDCRQVGNGAISTLTHQEIESYARLARIEFSPFEVRAVMTVDREFVFVYSKRKPKTTPPKGRK